MRFSLTQVAIINMFLGAFGGALMAQGPSSSLSTLLSTLLGGLVRIALLLAYRQAHYLYRVGAHLGIEFGILALVGDPDRPASMASKSCIYGDAR